MTDEKSKTPGMAEVAVAFEHEVIDQDAMLEKLADDWYAAHEVFDVAIAACEAAGNNIPEKQAERDRAEQHTRAPYEQMVNTPAEGPRGIYAKMRALVYPDQWKAFRVGEIASLDDDINPEMFYSLVADVERLAGESVSVASQAPAVPVIDEPLLTLERQWRKAEKAMEEENDDEKKHEFWRPVADAQDKIIATPARSIAGAIVKLRVYGCLAQEILGKPPIDQMPLSELGSAQAAVVSAIRDLERMTGKE